MTYTAPEDIQNLIQKELDKLLKIVEQETDSVKAGRIRAQYLKSKQEEE